MINTPLPSDSWEEFIEFGKGTPLLDVPLPEKQSIWAFTISPPKRGIPFSLAIVLDLLFYREYIKMGVMEVHPEFDNKQRLHYHAIIKPRGDLYGLDYEWFTNASTVKRRWLKLYKHMGLTLKGNPKWRKSRMTKLDAFVCFKTYNITDTWVEYCNKNAEETRRILGFDKIDINIFDKLYQLWQCQYKWEIQNCD